MRQIGSEGRGELVTTEGERLPVSFTSKLVSSVPINYAEKKEAEEFQKSLEDVRQWLRGEMEVIKSRRRSKHKFRTVDGICRYCGMSRAEHEFSHREASCVTKRRTKED